MADQQPMTRFTLFLLMIAAIAIPEKSFAQINIQWASRYTSAGSNIDRAIDLGRDGSGNVIVTGTSWNGSNFDIVTVKYDPNGNQMWAASYNGAGNGFDEARAISVDAAGNSYVTGFAEGASANYNVITIKYDPSGNQLWATTYNGTANGFDEGYDIQYDASGNVYVTGGSDGTSASTDVITLKYNSAGTQQWVARYNNTGANADAGYALDLDAAGDVYVTGYSWGGATNDFDIITIKYSSAGTQQWLHRYNGPGSRFDSGTDIHIATNGNVYVCGYTRAAVGITNYETATLCISPTGTLLWSRTYNGPGNDYDRANRLLVHPNGNIYITGRSVGTVQTAEDIINLCYNGTSGTLLWETRYDGGDVQYDEGKDINMDTNGDLYVTGWSYNVGSNNNYITFKYDTLGNLIWMTKYNGPAGNADQAYRMVVDSLGNIFLTGLSKGSGTNDDYNTIKYCQLTALVSGDTTICLGDQVQLSVASSFGAADTAVWTPTLGLNLSDPFNPIASPPYTTSYVVALTNEYGCTDYDTILVNVVPLPGPAIQSNGPLTFCDGGNVTLTAVDTVTVNVSYAWNTGDTTQSITVDSSGIYSVIITDTNTCSSMSQVTVNVIGLPIITAGQDTGFCQSTSIQLCATGGVSYSWAPSFGVSDTTIACPTFGPTSSTTYTVTGTDANGCSSTDSITLFLFPLPQVPVITLNFDTLQCSPAYNSYQWYLNSAIIPGATQQNYAPSQNGTYYVEVTDTNGCVAFSSTINVTDVSINEWNSVIDLKIIPNPSYGNFTIQGIENGDRNIEMLDLTGRVVLNTAVTNTSSQEINTVLPAGTYLLRVISEEGNVRQTRIVIRK